MKWLLILLFFKPIHAIACMPNEIHIHEQWVRSFTKRDGTKVQAHLRSEHCREIFGYNYFQNSSNKDLKGLNSPLKVWTEKDKKIFSLEFDKLPNWLKKYKFSEVLRATSHGGNPENPAIAFPSTKILVIFDKFFEMPNKKDVLIHELAHIAVWDFSPAPLQEFFISNGWKYQKGKPPKAPEKLLLPDSSQFPSEDFANTVELYYSDSNRLRKFNSQSYYILEKLIRSKETQK